MFTDQYYQPLQFIGDASGISMDKVNTLLCVVLAYPLGLIFRQIPVSNVTLRHALSGGIGLLFCILCFRWETLRLVEQIVGTYLIINFGGKYQQYIALAFCMLHLLGNNMYHRMYHWGEYGLNVNGPLMILTQKMSQLAFSVYDGQQDDSKKNDFLKELQIKRSPSILEIFGYAFNFSAVLLGPNFQYVDYKNMIEGVGVRGNPPSGVVAGLKSFVQAAFFIALNMMLPSYTGISGDPHRLVMGPYLEDGVTPNPQDQYNLFQCYLFNVMSMMLYRCNFYFAWGLAEGACQFAGLGYDGKDENGNEKWDRITNVRPYEVEFTENFKGILDNWNIQTQKWLRYVCYERTKSVYLTMLLSGIWHGPYIGYAFTFGFAIFIVESARKLRRNLRPMFEPKDKTKFSLVWRLYLFVSWLSAISILAYTVGPFVYLTVEKSLVFLNKMYWSGHIIVLALFFLVPPGKKKEPKKAEAKKE
eukprot:m.20282 g.20282  ORF g.20282 m.20282 type:complete len:473 (+) comp6796_c0_seq1:102-1520(+)